MGRSFDESKVSRDKEGRFKDQNKHHTPTDLPPAEPDTNRPVGDQFMDDVNDIASELFDRKQDWDDLPIGGCYRINDFGDYVTEPDWCEVWDDHPLEEKAWMLADNGQYSSDDVAKMTAAEIEAAYDDDNFDPAYVFYTEKEEDDYDLSEPIGTGMAQTIRQTGEQLDRQSHEAMDFQPGDRVHATPDGFVSEDEWDRAWNDQPAFCRSAYELSRRHPGLDMEKLSPMQIVTMNHSEKAYEEYVHASGGSRSNESDLRLSPNARRNAAMYRQNERNAQYVGRDLNNVICMRESAYTGNDGTLTANVRDATRRMLDAPDPTGDMDSLSTIALGLNHDTDNTVDAITATTSTRDGDGGLEQRLRTRLESEPDRWSIRDAEKMGTLMDCVGNNADDTQGAGWLADSLIAFSNHRKGNPEGAKRTAAFIHESLSKRHEPLPRPARTADMIARLILDH